MSSLKLKHSGGNSVSLNPPSSAPTSSDVAFKLPNADGSAGQVLQTDGSGNLSWVTPGLVHTDSWRLASDWAGATGTNHINAGWERDDTNFELIGTGLSHDGSGKFGFQATGKYLLTFFYSGAILSGNDTRYAGIRVYAATDGISGTYSEIAQSLDSVKGTDSGSTYAAGSIQKVLDITNTNTYFYISSYTTGSVTWRLSGNSSLNNNGFTSIKLGDT